jgi:predicted nucleic acid-binding protein
VTLLDTNVLIYASQANAVHHDWARLTVADAVASNGAAINAVTVAEICVGADHAATEIERVRDWGVEILDVPSAAAEVCAAAYGRYREQRRLQSGLDSSVVPLPDFFIGAHAEIMNWPLATADRSGIATYFPSVRLITPFPEPECPESPTISEPTGNPRTEVEQDGDHGGRS